MKVSCVFGFLPPPLDKRRGVPCSHAPVTSPLLALHGSTRPKVLALHLAFNTEFVERFLREARSTARLHHPNIVTIHDVGQEGGCYYFVVLDYAHHRGLVHRDIRPANIVVETDNHVTLADFGIARATTCTPQGYSAASQAGPAAEHADDRLWANPSRHSCAGASPQTKVHCLSLALGDWGNDGDYVDGHCSGHSVGVHSEQSQNDGGIPYSHTRCRCDQYKRQIRRRGTAPAPAVIYST